MRQIWLTALLMLTLGANATMAADAPAKAEAKAQAPARVFELRTYYCFPGRLEALQKRFREHTMKLFEKHGMTNVAYWVPQDSPARDNTLVYVISHASREAAKQSWAAFIADPEWKKVAEESQRDGKIVEKVESVFLDATDYSPMK